MYNIIYAGTPEFAVPALAALVNSEHHVVAVYTQPDRPAGRGRKLQQSPVKRFALEHNLTVCQPVNLKDRAAVDEIRAFSADLMIVAAYGLLLPVTVLSATRLGCVNIHASLLPRWRGASPIQQAILAGDEYSGVTLMKMDEGLDTGPMIAARRVAIEPGWTATELHDVLASLGAELLLESIDDIEAAIEQARVQDESGVTYAPRLSKQQAEIDWHKPVAELAREVRAFNPWPVSYTFLQDDNVRIWSARVATDIDKKLPGEVVLHDNRGVFVSCIDGVLQVTELQFAGRNRCTAAQALNARNLCGSLLCKQE